MESFVIKVPARINILGNPSDANEGAHQTISCAINLWAQAKVEPAEKIILENQGSGNQMELESASGLEIKSDHEFRFILASLKLLLQTSEELSEKIKANSGLKISYQSEVPKQSGLGGSTLLVHIGLLALVYFYELDRKKHNLYFLAELTQRIEEQELGITCGFADRYVPLLGDIAYIDYRGKLFHQPINQEPYCAYEKLGAYVEHPPLVVAFTGLEHQSGDVHKRMRSLYLEEFKGFKGDYENAPFMVRQMKKIGDTAWKGKIALLESDWRRFGALMDENHKLVDEMMRYCGFKQGAGELNNKIIELGKGLGALGGKLTGAGGGGSVFFLSFPGEEEKLAEELRNHFEKMGLAQAQVWVPSIVRQGAVVLEK